MPIKPSEIIYNPEKKPIGESKPVFVESPDFKKTEGFKFDTSKCKEKIAFIKEFFLKLSGRNTYNPYMYIHKEIQPLEDVLYGGNKSEELQLEILALKEDSNLCHFPALKKSQEEEEKQRTTKILPKNFEKRY